MGTFVTSRSAQVGPAACPVAIPDDLGASVSTAGEPHTFLDALFNGELISDAALTQMTTPGPDDYGLGLGLGLGLGPGLLELPSGTRRYGHDADIFGYLSFIAIEPVTGDIILSNNDALQPFALAEQLLSDG